LKLFATGFYEHARNNNQQTCGPSLFAKATGALAHRTVGGCMNASIQAEEPQLEQQEFFRMIVEHSVDFIAVLDLKGRRMYNSPSYGQLFGDVDAMTGSDSFAEIHPDDREHIRKIFSETVESGIGMHAEFRFVLPDGSIRHMESLGKLIYNSQGNPSFVVVISRDITERKRVEATIHSLAFYDELTGKPNRRLLHDRLALALAASRRSGRFGALMFIDLDNFKPLNDRYGHAAGDQLLQEAAQRISNCVRGVDTVSRFGGDEYVVVLSELDTDRATSVEQASFVAGKIRETLAEPYVLTIQREDNEDSAVTYHCSASIGVLLFSNAELGADEMIKRADQAMYQAKQNGRNTVCFFDRE
jgi:diguanylate cyclase (GGDEF)-like protein/PAS domain S-box-containing protein